MLVSEIPVSNLTHPDRDITFLILEKIYSGLNTKIKVNVNGHFKQKNPFLKNLFCCLNYIENNNFSQLNDLYSALLSNKKLDYFVFCGGDVQICKECGNRIQWECDGVELRATEICEYPWGCPSYDIRVNIPSGKMVIEDDLRQFYDIDLDLCSNSDRHISKMYETIGMGHGYIGNTNPNIYKTDSSIIIGNKNCNIGNVIGSIKTDLWWYSISDYEDIVKKTNKDINFKNIISVEPGSYLITHRSHIDNDIFAIIKKID